MWVLWSIQDWIASLHHNSLYAWLMICVTFSNLSPIGCHCQYSWGNCTDCICVPRGYSSRPCQVHPAHFWNIPLHNIPWDVLLLLQRQTTTTTKRESLWEEQDCCETCWMLWQVYELFTDQFYSIRPSDRKLGRGSLSDLLHKWAEIRTVATIWLSQYTMELSAKGGIGNCSHRPIAVCRLVKAGSRTHFQVQLWSATS